MPENTLTLIDNRTGTRYDIHIQDGTIRAQDLRQIKVTTDDFGLMTYDPGFTNTASCRSHITYIDGTKGILQYRGYPIEQLSEQSTYLETAYLLVNGELPSRDRLRNWTDDVRRYALVHENIKKLIDCFRHDAHPMGMLAGVVAALSTLYPESKDIFDPDCRYQQILRLIGQMPTIAAFCYRHRTGLPYIAPNNEPSYGGNFLNMLFKRPGARYEIHPAIERALDVLFILHADHEQNCSTHAMRGIGSSHADPYVATAGAIGALYGPLHGGANEAVLRMLVQIGSVHKVSEFVSRVKRGEGRLMGFGHRVYKSYDPRARFLKAMATRVFEIAGRNALLDIALELERIALEDEYFISRKLYPNVDFYSGLIYQSIGIPADMFPVMFAIPRVSGWLAQWQEELLDPDLKIARPRQIYQGERDRDYVAVSRRP